MSNTQKGVLVVAVLLVVLAAFVILRPPANDDSLGARIDRAAEQISEGVADAGKELKPESQKTVGEKVGNAVEDVGKEIKGTAH